MGRTLDELLDDARAKIERLTPSEALAAAEIGGLIIDIRSDLDREQLGVVPGSVHIPRTVLEWRVAAESPWRNSHLGEFDRTEADHPLRPRLLVQPRRHTRRTRPRRDRRDRRLRGLAENAPAGHAPARRRDRGELAGMGSPEPGA